MTRTRTLRARPGRAPRPAATTLLTAALVCTAVGIMPDPAAAQIKASEAATMSQTIDGTTITIEYSRPALRGRSLRGDLFGGQIRWGYVWTPGANAATTITSDKDFHLEGMAIPAGSYSVWMVTDPEEWTLVLDPDTDLYHTQGPSESEDQFRSPIVPDSVGWSVESLSWTMPAVRTDGGTLRMQWGDLAVDLELDVEPTVQIEIDAEAAAPYLGVFLVEQIAGRFGGAHEYELELRHENGLLRGALAFSPDFSMEAALVEVADQVFRPGVMTAGVVTEVVEELTIEFVLDADGQAVSFEARGTDDNLIQRGERIR